MTRAFFQSALPVFAGLLGLLFGSFLNVCIYRIPKKESVVTGASHCMSCGRPIQWYDLFPVLSYLVLRGRCRGCGAKISVRYPIIEALNAALWVMICLRFGLVPESALYCAFVSALIVAAFIDIDTTEVPPALTVFILVLGAAAVVLLRDMPFYERLIGLAAASVPLLLAAVLSKGGMGGGDIKLMAVCGLVLGWRLILLSLLLAVVSGAVYGGILLALRKKGRKSELPLVPFLAGGMLVSLLFGNSVIMGYLVLTGLSK